MNRFKVTSKHCREDTPYYIFILFRCVIESRKKKITLSRLLKQLFDKANKLRVLKFLIIFNILKFFFVGSLNVENNIFISRMKEQKMKFTKILFRSSVSFISSTLLVSVGFQTMDKNH